jgi:hypothetical protein
MENQQPQPSLINHAVKSGPILGVVLIIFSLIFYLINIEWLVSFKMWFLTLGAAIVYAAYAGISFRKENGGYLTFGKAYQHSFVLFVLASISLTAFNFILYFIIDPELPGMLTDVTIRNAEEMMSKFGMPQDQLDATLEQTRIETENGFKPTGLMLGFLYSLITYAILALISAAVGKKNAPEVQ